MKKRIRNQYLAWSAIFQGHQATYHMKRQSSFGTIPVANAFDGIGARYAQGESQRDQPDFIQGGNGKDRSGVASESRRSDH